MSEIILRRPFALLPLLLSFIACEQDMQGPGGPDPSFAKGDLDPIPELAYVGHVAPFISIVDVPRMMEIGRIPTGGATRNPVLSPDGKMMWVPRDNPAALLGIDLASNAVTVTLPLTAGSRPFDAALTPSGHRIFVTQYWGCTVAAVDTRSLEVLAVIPLGGADGRADGIVMGPGGHQVFVATEPAGRVYAIDTDALEVVATIEMGVTVNELALTQDGRHLLVVSTSGSVFVIDVKSFTVVTRIQVAPRANGIAIPPNGREAYVVHADRNLLTVIDTKTLSVAGTLAIPLGPRRIEVNTSGRLALVMTQLSSDPALVDLSERSILGRVSLPGGAPFGAAFRSGH